MARFGLMGPLMDLVPYRHEAALRELLAPGGAGGGTLLDVGGGTGRVARRMEPLFDRVVVLDAQPAMLGRVPEDGALAPVVADARRLPVAGAADAALMTDAFHHFPAQRAVLEEVLRALRPGGVLVLEEFDPTSWSGRAIRLFEWAARFGSVFHAPEALRAMVDAAGFRGARVVRFNRRDYAVVARAPG